jgi:D-glycerate 3-kinase
MRTVTRPAATSIAVFGSAGHNRTVDAVDALADLILPRLGPRPFVLGLAGAQGSGKSTLAARLAARLITAGHAALAISLDDFYLTRARRLALAGSVHPLFATRGPPGTHDLPLLLTILARVRAGQPLVLPQFDKFADDRLPPQHWRPAQPLACLILEGWCVGARPQPAAVLTAPINPLEADDDANGAWRRSINTALGGQYQRAWARLDALAFLAAPDWQTVPQWRSEQETALAARQQRPGMNEAAIARFCAHYERLTRWQLATTPARADLTLQLDSRRGVVAASKTLFR